MQPSPRNFEISKGVKERTAMIIGLAGETGTGKTVSAIRMALGMARVLGGRVAVVDTEGRRALNYAEIYDFDYIDFAPPFGPLDYKTAIQKAVSAGAKVIVVDTMTHEHSGEGGIMDQINRFLDDKCGDDYGKREKWNMIAHAKIKPQRKELNNYIIQLGRTGVILILCYRANDKTKPVTGQGMVHVGYVPETTSPLRWEMTQSFLLMPGSKGKPSLTPDTADEKIWAKTPMQFEKVITADQIDEALGEKLARWAAGGNPPSQTASKPAAVQPRSSSEAPAATQAPSLAPLCSKCGGGMNLVPAGTTKTGTKYAAFYGCKNRACKGTAKVEPELAIEEIDPPEFKLGRDYQPEHRDE